MQKTHELVAAEQAVQAALNEHNIAKAARAKAEKCVNRTARKLSDAYKRLSTVRAEDTACRLSESPTDRQLLPGLPGGSGLAPAGGWSSR
jgi:hypothetical protein